MSFLTQKNYPFISFTVVDKKYVFGKFSMNCFSHVLYCRGFTNSEQGPVMGPPEWSDEPSSSGAAEFVSYCTTSSFVALFNTITHFSYKY